MLWWKKTSMIKPLRIQDIVFTHTKLSLIPNNFNVSYYTVIKDLSIPQEYTDVITSCRKYPICSFVLCMQQKVRNSNLITGEDPQKSLVTLTSDPEYAALFPTECHAPISKRNYFVRSFFPYENVEIKKKPDFTANCLAGSQESKKHVVKMVGPSSPVSVRNGCFQQQCENRTSCRLKN